MRLLIQSLAFVMVASWASAQSLADVARKEAERRQALHESGKAYTNADLKPVPQPPPADDTTAEKDTDSQGDKDPAKGDGADAGARKASGDGKADGKPPEEEEVRDQAYWSKRRVALQEQLERDQTYAAALQSRVDALTMDFVNRDDPAQRDQIALDRQRAVSELERLGKAIEDDRRAIQDFEEEARRSGVPPGWLR